MSRYRNIHCLIWNDDKFPFASDDCQLVFFHLMTTPLSTPFGLYKASVEALAAEKRWPFSRYMEAIREGIAHSFFKYDERHHVILIPKFLKYNHPQSINTIKSWRKIYDEIPSSPLKVEFYQILKGMADVIPQAFLDAFADGIRYGIADAFPKACLIQEQEQYQEQYQEQNKEKHLLTEMQKESVEDSASPTSTSRQDEKILTDPEDTIQGEAKDVNRDDGKDVKRKTLSDSGVKCLGEAKPEAKSEEPRRKRSISKMSDQEWLESLKANPAYQAIDIERLHHKMLAWCEINGKKPTRKRLINWLNREEVPMQAQAGPKVSRSMQNIRNYLKRQEEKNEERKGNQDIFDTSSGVSGT